MTINYDGFSIVKKRAFIKYQPNCISLECHDFECWVCWLTVEFFSCFVLNFSAVT